MVIEVQEYGFPATGRPKTSDTWCFDRFRATIPEPSATEDIIPRASLGAALATLQGFCAQTLGF